MNDQQNPWEADWREELAGYEAPLQPGDWAKMEGLLDGGAPAPPDAGTMTAGKAAGGISGLTKLMVGLALIILAGLGYWLSRGEEQVPLVTEQVAPAVLDTLPPGYHYDVTTRKQLDREGKLLSVTYDTTIVPAAARREVSTPALARSEGAGSPQVPVPQLLGSNPASVTAPTPSTAPESPPATADEPTSEERRVLPGNSTSTPSRNSYNLTPKPARERPVPRLRFPLMWEQPGYDNYTQWRLEQIVREHPVKVVPAKTFNGYFPAYRDGF